MTEPLAGRTRRAPLHVIALLAGGALVAAAPATAQPRLGDEPLVAFEAARVEPSRSASKRLEVERRTGNFTARNASLADLIAFAYGVRTDQIVDLPAWAAAPRYDVEGRAPKQLAGRDAKQLAEDVRPLIAGLLVDYFSLEAHRSQSPIQHDPKTLAAELERQLGLTLRVVQFEVVVVERAMELGSGVN